MEFMDEIGVKPDAPLERRLCVAPMMDWTHRHCRFLHRLLAPNALLYTEMINSFAILRGDRTRLLAFDPAEHPLALQLGGSDPAALAQCASIAQRLGFDEVNLNLGCPSDRVRSGRFGACLMREPRRVAACLSAMLDAVEIAVSVKLRIGVDDMDSWAQLRDFVGELASAGCGVFIVHARKAWLTGLSPKQNREVPPLDYARVYRLKAAFPDLCIVINGGVTSAAQLEGHLRSTDGVMLGRAAYHDPIVLSRCHAVLWPQVALPDRVEIVQKMIRYAERQAACEGFSMGALCRPLLGLFHGLPGARRWRRMLSEGARGSAATPRLLVQALHAVEAGVASYGTGVPGA